jgi:lipoate-protein ligase A
LRSYVVVGTTAPAADLHHRSLPTPLVPTIWWNEVSAPALVLGSTQSTSIVDAAACRERGVDVVVRRSGGGAVLLVPGCVTWLDVVVPATSRDWIADVNAQMVWLGDELAGLIGEQIDGDRLAVHRGALVATPWSRTVCFDGVGPGEVLLDGVKLVGISQRRTRDAARLLACWYSAYDHSAMVELLDDGVRPPLEQLQPVATLDSIVANAVLDALRNRRKLGEDG